MRKVVTIAVLALLGVLPLQAGATDACLYERAARILSSAYESGNPDDSPFRSSGKTGPTLLKDIVLDKQKITIVHEHSIRNDVEEKPIIVTSYAELASWLAKLHTPDKHGYVYSSDVRTLGECKSGCCEFPFIHGISHNTLYLKKACFGMERNIPYLKEVVVYDGD